MNGWKRSTKLSPAEDHIAYLNKNGNISFKLLQNISEIKSDKSTTVFLSNAATEIFGSFDSELNIKYEKDEEFVPVKIKNIDTSKLFHIKKTSNGEIKKNILPEYGISGEFNHYTNVNIYNDMELNNIILKLIKSGYSVDFTKIVVNNQIEGYNIYYSLFDKFISLTNLEKDFYKIDKDIKIPLLGIKINDDEDIHSICIQRCGKMAWIKY